MSDTAITTALPGPAPEVGVTKDMVKRGLVVAPVLIAVCGFIWGMEGAYSAAYGIALVDRKSTRLNSSH